MSEFQNSTPRLHFQSRDIFVIFLRFSRIFANRSQLPNFCVLNAPARSEYGNEVQFSKKSCFTILNMHNINLIMYQCNPVNTLYSRIMYNYAQFNKMKIFPRFWYIIKLILCILKMVKHDFWLNGTSFPYSDRAGAFRTQKLGK